MMEMQVSVAKMKVMNKQEIVMMMKMSNLMRTTKVVIIQTGVNMIQMMRLTLNPSDQC